MANIKENELPVAGSISNGDYLRIVTPGGSSQRASAANLINALGGIEYKKLLWTNPNPSSNFTAQTVSLDLTEYDAVEIQCKNLASSDYMIGTLFRIKKGDKGLLLSNAATNRERDVHSVSNTGIEFSGGIIYNTYGGAQSTDNSRVIPIRIYGIKYVNSI